MKAIVCEMCNSNNMLKKDGVFICQNCGTQYSVDEAKKLMVEVEGTVKIDTSDEMAKLYQAARNARKSHDYATAVADYEMLTRMDPDNWEPVFYAVILKTFGIKNGEIEASSVKITNCIDAVFGLIKKLPSDEQKDAVKEVVDKCIESADRLIAGSHGFRNGVTGGAGGIITTSVLSPVVGLGNMAKRYEEDRQRCVTIALIPLQLAGSIEDKFGIEDSFFKRLYIHCNKTVIRFNKECIAENKVNGVPLFKKEFITELENKIKLTEKTSGLSNSDISSADKDKIIKLEKANLEAEDALKEAKSKCKKGAILLIVGIYVAFGLGVSSVKNAGPNGGLEAIGYILVFVGLVGVGIGAAWLKKALVGENSIKALTEKIEHNTTALNRLKKN